MAQTGALSIRPSDFHPVLNFLGCSQFASDPLLKACLDDVRIYDYALDAGEVAAVMAGTELGISPVETTQRAKIGTSYYSPDGKQLSQPQKGLNIVKDYYDDGSTQSKTSIIK